MKCKKLIEEEVYQPLKQSKGMCLPCAMNSVRLNLQDEDAMTELAEKIESPQLDSPPPGEKFCMCGCKGTLPADHAWSFLKGHKTTKAKAAASPVASTKLPDILKQLRDEINWRERRQRELEQEMGLNIQKIRLLRQTAQALEAAL